ncbi:MAG: 2-C-methyl-D-erythritol 4-phosphate cytidylyltransferase [Bacteroidales bacterium]
MSNRVALIVAGGSGIRMGNAVPKQFLPIKGIPILMRTLNVFYSLSHKPEIVLVLPEQEQDRWRNLCKSLSYNVPHALVNGGESRFLSVKNGLETINNDGLVAIHDGVRPLVTTDLVEQCYLTAQQKGNAVPAIKPLESVRVGTNQNNRIENRELCWLVQTPQVFHIKDIKKYYNTSWHPHFTDDASVAEHHGARINILEGNRENIKITTPLDILWAETILD